MASIESSVAPSSPGTFDRLRPFTIVLTSAAISAVAIATALRPGLNEYTWRAATQQSGRVAVLLFLIPFLAGPLARLIPSRATRGLLIDRRAYGFGFALAFAAYVGTFIAPYLISGATIPITTLVFTAIGISLLVLQIVTSNALSIRVLGFAAWQRVHAFAMYAYWLAFTATFLDRVVGPSRPDEFMPIALMLMVVALLVRFSASFAVRTGLAEKVD